MFGALVGCGGQARPSDGAPNSAGIAHSQGQAGTIAAEVGGNPASGTGGGGGPLGGAGGTADPSGAGSEPAAGGVAMSDERPHFSNYALTGSWPNRPVAVVARPGALVYTKLTLHTRFLGESCAIGDYDGDGNPDVSSGRRWYRGPFTDAGGAPTPIEERIFRGGHDDLPRDGLGAELVTGVADDQSDFAFDMDGDGDVDIVNIASPDVDETQTPSPAPAPQPHATAYWYENPGPALVAETDVWPAHLIHTDVRHEQHGIVDVDGDGWPEIYGACKSCMPSRTFGYYRRDPKNPQAPWSYHAVTQQKEFPFNGTGWMHGLGFGDLNGDGKPDLIERSGAWLDVLSPLGSGDGCAGSGCYVQAQLYGGGAGAELGGSHMFAVDVDGDGDSDVISADYAHRTGISWWENVGQNTLQLTKHKFVGGNEEKAMYDGIGFSQPHALEVVDLDADGVPEVITGKTRFANPDGCGDPDLRGDLVSYAFKIVRDQPSSAGAVSFRAFPIDTSTGAVGTAEGKAGVGRQIAAGHLDHDGIVDLCLATKLGLHVYLGR